MNNLIGKRVQHARTGKTGVIEAADTTSGSLNPESIIVITEQIEIPEPTAAEKAAPLLMLPAPCEHRVQRHIAYTSAAIYSRCECCGKLVSVPPENFAAPLPEWLDTRPRYRRNICLPHQSYTRQFQPVPA